MARRLLIVVAVATAVAVIAAVSSSNSFYDYVKCQICEAGDVPRQHRPSAPASRVACCDDSKFHALRVFILYGGRLQVPALTGEIEDCRCDVETVDQINVRHFLPILHNLTKRRARA